MRSLLAIGICVIAGPLFAQNAADAPATEAKDPDKPDRPAINQLPEPLQDVWGNVTDLEKRGYFTVTEVRFGAAPFRTGGQAVIWTLRAKENVTWRTVATFLKHFRDVRFYRTEEKGSYELYNTFLEWSDLVDTYATTRKVLRRDNVFEVWVRLSVVKLRKIRTQEVNELVFSRPVR